MKFLPLFRPLLVSGVLVSTATRPVSAQARASVSDETRTAVERLRQLGVLEGYPDGKHRGDRMVTRTEAAVTIRRLLDKTAPLSLREIPSTAAALRVAFSASDEGAAPEPDGFIQYDYAHWGVPAFLSLKAEGVVRTFPDGRYRGKRSLTRQELAAVVARLVTRQPVPPPFWVEVANFHDVEGAEWSYGSILVAAGTGVMRGYRDGTFHPKQKVTRNELAVTLSRLLRVAPNTSTPEATWSALLSALRSGDEYTIRCLTTPSGFCYLTVWNYDPMSPRPAESHPRKRLSMFQQRAQHWSKLAVCWAHEEKNHALLSLDSVQTRDFKTDTAVQALFVRDAQGLKFDGLHSSP